MHFASGKKFSIGKEKLSLGSLKTPRNYREEFNGDKNDPQSEAQQRNAINWRARKLQRLQNENVKRVKCRNKNSEAEYIFSNKLLPSFYLRILNIAPNKHLIPLSAKYFDCLKNERFQIL